MMQEVEYLSWPCKTTEFIGIHKFVDKKPVLKHKHEFVEIVFICKGSGLHMYNGIERPVVSGDAFIVHPTEEHSYNFSRETVIYNCLFYPEALGEDWKQLKEISSIYDFIMVEPYYRGEAGRPQILHLKPIDYEYIEKILKGMIHEQEQNSKGKELMLKSKLIMLLLYLGRIWENQFGHQSSVLEGKRVLLNEAIEYINDNLANDITLCDLAAKTYMSPGHFGKQFKENFGISPIDYINKLRISKAINYLVEGRYTVSQISELVGISDPNYFARIFKKVTGYVPSTYIKNHIE